MTSTTGRSAGPALIEPLEEPVVSQGRGEQERVDAVGNFYNAIDIESTRTFLKTYDVKYIIVGQLERASYTPEGLAKFEQFDGTLWRSVYRDGSTAIYEVLP